ncbi:hypothetical protein C0J52_09593 [Blattella germanica]|nr:hypothetical protein C0J52_09593 [Blattella germanica]
MMQQIKDEVSDVSEVELRYSDSEVEEKKILQRQIKEEVNDALEEVPHHNDYTAEYKNNFIKMPPIEICENQMLALGYHPDLNPIELIWNLINAKVADNNTDHVSLSTLKSLTRDSIGAITVNDWKNSVQKVKAIQETYWKRDALVEEEMERLIINPGLDSSDESGEETDTATKRMDNAM